MNYFDLLNKHFEARKSAIDALSGHPRIQRMARVELAYEQALIEECRNFEDCVIYDVITNESGQSKPRVVLSNISHLRDVLNNYPVYSTSLFGFNDVDQVCFQVHFVDNDKRPDNYMIYPCEDSEESFATLTKKVSSDVGENVILFPIGIRKANTLEWLDYKLKEE